MDSLGCIFFVADKVGSTTVTLLALISTEFGQIMQNNGPLRRSRSFKVTDFGTY